MTGITHPWILTARLRSGCWTTQPAPRPGARQAITSARRVYVSAATVWELTIETILGKLSVPPDLSTRLTSHGVALFSITAEHAEARWGAIRSRLAPAAAGTGNGLPPHPPLQHRTKLHGCPSHAAPARVSQ